MPMSSPNTRPAGRRAPRRPRSRRGWGWAARLGLAMLAGACAGAGQAQSLDEAVDGIAEMLKLRGRLEGQQVLVRPGYFFEMGSERNLPLSEYLALQFTQKLARHGVKPISRSEDEDTAITLQGRWNIESGELVLSVTAQQAAGAGLNTGVSRASEERRVPVANIARKYLEPDLESHGRYVVRQLEKGIAVNTSGNGRYRLHMRPFSAPDVANPGRFTRYLRGKWRPAFTGSRRFSLVGRDGSNGELHSDVFVAGERIEVHLHILDGQGQEVAATTVEMDKKLFPPGFFGPDVSAELARCVELVEARRLGDAKGCYEGVRAGASGDASAAEEVRSGLARIAEIERVVRAEAAAVRGVEAAIGRGEFGEAKEWLKRLRELNARHPRLAGLRGDLDRAEREAREEAARRASEQAEAERKRRAAEEERRRKAREEAERRRRLREPGRKFRDCPECPELVVVRSGSFMMGSPGSEAGRRDREGPAHRVRIAERFAVGVYEVTRGEYGRFVSATGHGSGDSCRTYEGGGWEARSGRGWRNPGFRQADGHPVVCVSWSDAKAYVRWLSGETGESYRLLSEAEWEYVARAGTEASRYWGESESGQCRYANGADAAVKRRDGDWKWATVSCDDGHARTSPVGTFSPNGWKLHDVMGNVLEWVEDCGNESYAGAPRDGSAWESGNCGKRVLRGGSWNYRPRFLRSANRGWISTGLRSSHVGFRVARTLAP